MVKLVLFFILLYTSLQGSPWDVEYWQSLSINQWQSHSYRLYATAEMRINQDVSTCYFYRITENFAYTANSWFDLEAHLSYIRNRTFLSPHFINRGRIELEFNPFMSFKNGVQLRSRNRLEMSKVENVANIEFTLRHRFMVVFPITDYGKLSLIRIHDEIFYSFQTTTFSQNRFTPLEMVFTMNQRISLIVFVMLRTMKTAQTWHRSVVFGSSLEF